MQPNRTALREEFSAVGPPACVGSRRRPRGDAVDARQGRSVVSGSRAISAAMCRSNRLVHGWLPTVGRRSGEGNPGPEDGTEWALHDGRGQRGDLVVTPDSTPARCTCRWRSRRPAPPKHLVAVEGSLRWRPIEGRPNHRFRTAAHELDFGARKRRRQMRSQQTAATHVSTARRTTPSVPAAADSSQSRTSPASSAQRSASSGAITLHLNC